MRGFRSAAVLLLALFSGVSSFVVPVPCARAAASRTPPSAVRRTDHVGGRPSQEATTGRLVLAAAPRGGGENGGDEVEEKAGIEPKCELLLALSWIRHACFEGDERCLLFCLNPAFSRFPRVPAEQGRLSLRRCGSLFLFFFCINVAKSCTSVFVQAGDLSRYRWILSVDLVWSHVYSVTTTHSVWVCTYIIEIKPCLAVRIAVPTSLCLAGEIPGIGQKCSTLFLGLGRALNSKNPSNSAD